MKNDIIRKLTSLTLMSIMVAGGLTFAIPSALPQAAAAPGTDGTLTVSSTEFGGQQIIEIQIRDSDIDDVDTRLGLPEVSIDGNDVRMVQAVTGVWYAYVANTSAIGTDRVQSLVTDDTAVAPGSNSVPTNIKMITIDNYPTANDAEADDTNNGITNWPFVQTYDFDSGDEFEVVYGSDRVKVTYDDDLTDSVTLALDRTNVPQKGMVHITISDPRLNLDPTGQDSWLLYLNDAKTPQLVDNDDTESDRVAPANVTLGDAGHGDIDVPGELDVTPRADADPFTDDDSKYIMFEETERNSGEFVSFVEDDSSPIGVSATADINSRVTVSYAGEDATLTVRDESTDISITSDDFWNSGEPATVTVEAPNLNLNTQTDDHVTIDSELIPTIMVGDPITIADFSFSKAEIAYNDADATHTAPNGDTLAVDTTDAPNELLNSETDERISVKDLVTTIVQHRDAGECTLIAETAIINECTDDDNDGDIETGDLVDQNRDGDFDADDGAQVDTTNTVHGEASDESKLLTITGTADTELTLTLNMDDDDDRIVSAPFYYIHTSAGENVHFELRNGTTSADTILNNNTVTAITDPLSQTLELTVTKKNDAAFGNETLVFDILSFGAITDDDGDITSVENNAIYRHLLEETDEGGVFEGTLEYTMLNQVNIRQADTYEVTTQSNELVMVIDDEYTGNDLQISYAGETAHVEVLTSGGTVSLDSDSYSTNGSVSITLIDQDLNVDNDEEESYTLNQDGTVRGENTAELLVFEIDDKVWESCDEDSELGLPADFTLEESADEPGTFTASFDIPTTYCDGSDDGTGAVTGKSLQVTYSDFRDDTGIATTWSDSATIQAITGTVTIDRNVYPVPTQPDEDGRGSVVVHIEISDSDSNADSDVLDKIEVGDVPALDSAGNPEENESTVRVEITPVSASSPDDISDTTAERKTIKLGDVFEETSEDSGVFAQTITIPHNILGANNLIEQSFILSVTYTDPSDATGDESEATDSAIFNIGTATLGTDATEYALKQTAFVTLVDHDSNYDSDTRETIPLGAIVWEGSSDTDLSNLAAFDPSPPFLRETESNSGIFQTEITIPEVIKERSGDDGDEVERGESVTLTYTDNSPAGADRPGLDERDAETGFTILRTGASLTLDKDVYSWRDRVTITVVAPDFNVDSLAVESIGNDDEVRIRSQLDSDTATLTETGPNTGIFQGTIDLGGFKYEVANNVMAQPANLLQVGSEDGISVTFTYDEDERDLIQSALIRWNVAEVTWVEDSYREGATGILRVVDPDRNLHPDTPDSIETIVFSDTYRGGIRVALTETESSSGVFEGAVIFDVLHSEGNRLQVSEGDIVTAAYDDATLPPPDDGDDLRVTGTTTVGSIVPPLERVAVSNLGVVDALGSAVDSVSVGQQVNIAADLTSAQSRSQDYAYLLQIQNMDGVTVHLSWAASSLAGFGGANVSQSWTPDETGSYTATVFVWESLTNPTALSPQNSIDITVV